MKILLVVILVNNLSFLLLFLLTIMYGHYAATLFKNSTWWWSENIVSRYYGLCGFFITVGVLSVIQVFIGVAIGTGLIGPDISTQSEMLLIAWAICAFLLAIIWLSIEMDQIGGPEEDYFDDYL